MSRAVLATPANWRIREEWRRICRVGGQWPFSRQTKTDETSTDECSSMPTGRAREAVVSPQDQQSLQEPRAATRIPFRIPPGLRPVRWTEMSSQDDILPDHKHICLLG